jgi:branched-chain amino acid aminotransferase
MDILGLKVEERDVLISDLDEFEEIGACGTAAAVTPIYEIVHKDKVIYHKDLNKVGFISKQLSKIMTEIQIGDFKLLNKWVMSIK